MYGNMTELSILIPVFNDQEVLPELIKRLIPVVIAVSLQYEIIFVDDGSSDNSFDILKKYREKNSNIKILKLTKNFGQSNAISAGLEKVTGEIVVIMDSDLQDKPEDIPKLLNALKDSNKKIAIARWETQKASLCKTVPANIFFKISNCITNIHHPLHMGVFRAFYREVYDKHIKPFTYSGTTLSQFYKLHLDYAFVSLHRDKRFAGKSGYDLKKMVRLALDRIIPNLRFVNKTYKRKPYYKIEQFLG
jgi:dolichol-phosphate mannosyltransferase